MREGSIEAPLGGRDVCLSLSVCVCLDFKLCFRLDRRSGGFRRFGAKPPVKLREIVKIELADYLGVSIL